MAEKTVPAPPKQIGGNAVPPAAVISGGGGDTSTGGSGGSAPTATPAATVTPASASTIDSQVNEAGGSGGLAPMLAQGLSNFDFSASLGASPGKPKGFGKGNKEPALTRAADLVKIVNAIASGGSTSGLNQAAVAGVFKQAGVKPPVGGLESIVGDIGVGLSRNPVNDPNYKNTFSQSQLSASQRQAVYEAAWKDMAKHADSVVGVPNKLRTPPPMNQAVSTLRKIGNLPVLEATKTEIADDGFANITPGYNFSDLVRDQDEFQKGAPGGAGTAATPNVQSMTGANLYNKFMEAYTQGASWATAWGSQLEGAGYVDAADLASGTAPSATQVGQGFQALMKDVQSYEKTTGKSASLTQALVAGYNGKNLMGEPNGNPISVAAGGAGPNTAYVEHIAAQVGVQLPQSTINAIANRMASIGTDNLNTEDLVNKAVTDAASDVINNAVQNNTPIPAYGGWAAFAEQQIQQTYAQQGISLPPAQVAKLVAATMASGVTSIYATGDQASALATEGAPSANGTVLPGAKLQAAQQVGGGANGTESYLGQQIMNGTTLSSLAQPYFEVAQNTLGVAAADLSPTNPMYMKWTTGGADGGPMTQAQWSQYLMTDPTYGYANSAQSEATGSAGVMSLASLIGINPAGSFNIPSSGSTAGQETP